MTLILPQTKFEAITSEDVGRVVVSAEADTSYQILGCNNFSP